MRRTGVVLISVGLSAFAVVAVVVLTGASAGFDQAVHDAVIGLRAEWLDPVMIAISTVFGLAYLACAALAVAAAFWFTGRRWSAVLLAGAMAATVAVATVVKYVVARERPNPTLWLGPGEDLFRSFPSGHVICTCAFVLVAGYLWWSAGPSWGRLATWLVLAVVITAAVAFSRLYLGVHWLTDTLASVTLAVAMLGTVMVADVRWRAPFPDRASAPEDPRTSAVDAPDERVDSRRLPV